MVEVLKKSIDDMRFSANKLQTVELDNFLQKIQQYTLHDSHLKFSEIKQELDGAIEIIRVINEKNPTVIKHKPNLTPKVFECEPQKCINEINNIIANEQFNDIPIKALRNLLETLPNTINRDDIELVNALESAIDGAIVIINTSMQYVRQVSHNDYDESHIAIAKNFVNPSEFQMNIVSNGLSELMIGYEGLITDSVVTLLTNAIDYGKIDKIEETVEKQLLEYITQLNEHTKTHTNAINMELTMNILQSKIKLFVHTWNTFQQYKYRYYNFFIYCIYCITNNNTQPKSIFRYVDVKVLGHYLEILDDITKQFDRQKSNTQQQNASNIIQYFNVCHYHTIKTLRKFIKFFGRVMIPTQIIDVFYCQEDVKQSFIIFNQFKELLDMYEEKIMKKQVHTVI